ncbi:ExbD/TolR family protein [Thaumasiovibrio subtropicus]|uniref:ExbD/TolR family protein n=1 Tax=Thaumasiovibrio subtropicus TaxID=1891207 RepID=UPI000B351242|nr:biopolymer transporter ExbD [Thaumasiovibrio subtropicus]
MISSQSHQSSQDFKPDLTPLLDIIFIVMVFLLLTASINIQTLEIDVPQTDEESVLTNVEQDVIAINIKSTAPHWAINGTTYTHWDEFTQALLDNVAEHPEHSLILGADKQANVELMLKMLAFMQKHHLSQTQIIMEEAPQ